MARLPGHRSTWWALSSGRGRRRAAPAQGGGSGGVSKGGARGAQALRRTALLLVNDRPDVAASPRQTASTSDKRIALAAARAILGPGALIGVSTHSDAEIDAAAGRGLHRLRSHFRHRLEAGTGRFRHPRHWGLRRAYGAPGSPWSRSGHHHREGLRGGGAGARCVAAIAELCFAPDLS